MVTLNLTVSCIKYDWSGGCSVVILPSGSATETIFVYGEFWLQQADPPPLDEAGEMKLSFDHL